MFTTWILLFFSAMIIGMSKAGLKGVEMLSVTIMAFIFGGKSSTGIVLPLLCFADILAVIYYNRHAQWNHFKKIIPWMMTGILLGVFIGKDLNEFLFKKIMASIILITIAIVLYMENRKSEKVPTNPFFVASTGLAAGFTTMIGNLAGAFANLYFLAMRVSKNDFIGTAAWIFLFMNLFKLPFQVFYWKNINWQTFSTDLYLIPGIIIGFFIGVKIIHKIKDHHYRKLVILLTLIGSVVLLIQQ
jgi:uncharacterized membrane protein YfcA